MECLWALERHSAESKRSSTFSRILTVTGEGGRGTACWDWEQGGGKCGRGWFHWQSIPCTECLWALERHLAVSKGISGFSRILTLTGEGGTATACWDWEQGGGKPGGGRFHWQGIHHAMCVSFRKAFSGIQESSGFSRLQTLTGEGGRGTACWDWEQGGGKRGGGQFHWQSIPAWNVCEL